MAPTDPRTDLPVLADYRSGSWLGAVLPGAAAALGVDLGLPADALPSLPAAPRVCVVLVDGLGERQLADQADHAPFLTGLDRRVLCAGAPTTTATSMASFGTGLPPGAHGLAGYSVLDPRRGELLNELRWHPDTDPLRWQPRPTVFEQLAAAGRTSLAIGNPEFAGSGLTLAAHRGAAFVGARRLHKRVDTALGALADPRGPDLVYLYWGEVDAAGHRRGWRSPQWRRAVRHLDRSLSRLAARLPVGTLLLVTSDHGMVDAAAVDRVDIADRPELAADVRLVGGEPRLVQLYLDRPDDPSVAPGGAAAPDSAAAPDALADEVADRYREQLGERAWVATRSQAQQWFGAMSPRTAARFGDVVIAARGLFTLVDSRTMTESERSLTGYHGSLTADEQEVPLAVLVR